MGFFDDKILATSVILIIILSIIGGISNVAIFIAKLTKFRQLTGRDFLVLNMAFSMAYYCVANILKEIDDYIYKLQGSYFCSSKFLFFQVPLNVIDLSLIGMLIIITCSKNVSKTCATVAIAFAWALSIISKIIEVKMGKNLLADYFDVCHDYANYNYNMFSRLLLPMSIFMVIIVTLVKNGEELMKKDLFSYAIIFGVCVLFCSSFPKISKILEKFAENHYSHYHKFYEFFSPFLSSILGIVHTTAYFYVDQSMYQKVLNFLRIKSQNNSSIRANYIECEIGETTNV